MLMGGAAVTAAAAAFLRDTASLSFHTASLRTGRSGDWPPDPNAAAARATSRSLTAHATPDKASAPASEATATLVDASAEGALASELTATLPGGTSVKVEAVSGCTVEGLRLTERLTAAEGAAAGCRVEGLRLTERLAVTEGAAETGTATVVGSSTEGLRLTERLAAGEGAAEMGAAAMAATVATSSSETMQLETSSDSFPADAESSWALSASWTTSTASTDSTASASAARAASIALSPSSRSLPMASRLPTLDRRLDDSGMSHGGASPSAEPSQPEGDCSTDARLGL